MGGEGRAGLLWRMMLMLIMQTYVAWHDTGMTPPMLEARRNPRSANWCGLQTRSRNHAQREYGERGGGTEYAVKKYIKCFTKVWDRTPDKWPLFDWMYDITGLDA